MTIYKCSNKKCHCRTQALNKLNPAERLVRGKLSSQFKLRYQYREYHYTPTELIHSSPHVPAVDLTKIHNSSDILGLVLTFHVSFAITARKTALIFDLSSISPSLSNRPQLAPSASFSCHRFNFLHKGPIDNVSSGDETYIKILGKHFYVFFFISSDNHKITAYPSLTHEIHYPLSSMNESIRTASPDQPLTLITDGNPSYMAGLHFINSQQQSSHIQHHTVIGLQNLDKESEEFRPFKQLIERLNRTYKHHVRPANGFNSTNGAVALTTLFVTHYNFLRPHMALNYKTPAHIPELDSISTIQGKWCKILSLAA